MDESLCFRTATKSDLPDVLRLYAQPDLDDGKVLPLSEAERIFEQMLIYPHYKTYVVVIQGRVVGAFSLLVMDNLGHLGAPSAIIDDVAVDPMFQGQGIGKAMLRHAIQLGTEYGCQKIVLSSNLKRERAHSFYESLEFERHGYSFRLNPGHYAQL